MTRVSDNYVFTARMGDNYYDVLYYQTSKISYLFALYIIFSSIFSVSQIYDSSDDHFQHSRQH